MVYILKNKHNTRKKYKEIAILSCQVQTYVVEFLCMSFSRRSEAGHAGPILVSGGYKGCRCDKFKEREEKL